MRAALYMRETPDGKPVAKKRTQLRAACKEAGWTIAEDIVEGSTNAASAEDCPGLTSLFISAKLNIFDVVVITSMDEFFRRNVADTFQMVARLKKIGVDVHSVTEPHFSTIGKPGQQLLKITAWITEHERQSRSDAVKAGLSLSRLEGKKLGRPAANVNVEAVRSLKAGGLKVEEIALQLGISRSLVYEVLKGGKGE